MLANELQDIKNRYGIVGNSTGLNLAIETALKVAAVDLNVLIVGENGVGKEVFPRILHDHSLRKMGKYFAINCGSIPEGTIDSELFGHEKGAFTGAVSEREGYFAAANGGTLFLDEVGELPLSTQARLLRVLETGEYIRVGSSKVLKTDVRIVAATNVDMETAIAKGRFRQDLYYRLNTIPIQVPPLRERGEDVILLFRKFAFEMSERYHFPSIRLTSEAEALLLQYSWPGNVRQLKNLAENISITAETREISAAQLTLYLPQNTATHEVVLVKQPLMATNEPFDHGVWLQMYSDLKREINELRQTLYTLQQQSGDHTARLDELCPSATALTRPTPKALPAPSDLPIITTADPSLPSPIATEHTYTEEIQTLEEMERDFIHRALLRNNWSRKNAAKELGMSERTLYRKIKDYGWKEDN
ncbi:MAG: sigma-54 dependent transcriptional regulator [Bacteroidales bacterium]|nr:sigma-54 dependent transcriptional regulator [Bacteroidales bacterium]